MRTPRNTEILNSVFPEENYVLVECFHFHSLSHKKCYWQAWPAFPALTEECQVADKDGKEQEET